MTTHGMSRQQQLALAAALLLVFFGVLIITLLGSPAKVVFGAQASALSSLMESSEGQLEYVGGGGGRTLSLSSLYSANSSAFFSPSELSPIELDPYFSNAPLARRRSQRNLPQTLFMSSGGGKSKKECKGYKDWVISSRIGHSFKCAGCSGTWGSYWIRTMEKMGYVQTSNVRSDTLFLLDYAKKGCLKYSDQISQQRAVRMCARSEEIPRGFASKGAPEEWIQEYCKRKEHQMRGQSEAESGLVMAGCEVPPSYYIPTYFLVKSYKEGSPDGVIDRLRSAAQAEQQENQGDNSLPNAWILKSLSGYASKGNKIVSSIAHAINEVENSNMDSFLLQEYEMRPLLHQGRKISLRCFVVILSMNPLRVVYVDGPVFRAVKKYDGYGFDRLAHLTNAFFEAPQFKSQTAKLEEDTILDFSYLPAAVAASSGARKLGIGGKARDAANWVRDVLRPTIKSIAKTAVLALYEHANKDFIKNFEGMTGVPLCFDFMINDDLRVWFHEYNVGCGLRGSPSLPNQWRVDSFGNTLLLMEELHYRIQRGDVSTRLSDMCWSPFLTRDYTDLEILIDGEADV
mmetsp:Transcript_14531/g.37080  ORF Transcript_14531/g.37080 Transcript_14531/m.37080 type:complete len:571 (-) Transcript_14531:1041-2753(-)